MNYLVVCVLDKNPCIKNGNTPLHFAAKCGHFEICKLFLTYDIEGHKKWKNIPLINSKQIRSVFPIFVAFSENLYFNRG